LTGNRLGPVNSWALYYGMDRTVPLDQFDFVVVAPEAWDRVAIRQLQAGGTRVAAYLSMLEVPRATLVAAPADVLVIDGEPAYQVRWGNWILDPRRPGTAARIQALAANLADYYDGLFLDTMGDVESALLPRALCGRLLPATARLVADLRQRFPATALVQNWGLGALLNLTSPYLDGVCWEDFPTGPAQPWQSQLAMRMTEVARRGVQVLALSQNEEPESRQWAQELGFPWYGAPGSYIDMAGGVRQ
jgi:hypothetical protein